MKNRDNFLNSARIDLKPIRIDSWANFTPRNDHCGHFWEKIVVLEHIVTFKRDLLPGGPWPWVVRGPWEGSETQSGPQNGLHTTDLKRYRVVPVRFPAGFYDSLGMFEHILTDFRFFSIFYTPPLALFSVPFFDIFGIDGKSIQFGQIIPKFQHNFMFFYESFGWACTGA